MSPLQPVVLFLLTAVNFFVAGYLFRQAQARRNEMCRRLSPLAPAPLALGDVSDLDLVSEFMERAYRSAVCRGDAEQLAAIYHMAKQDPALLQRFTALAAERPVSTFVHRRAQA